MAKRLLDGASFKPSENDYDWLGSGVYFRESNPLRALHFAEELARRGRTGLRTPAVIGAVIDLGLCLDLISSNGIQAVESAYTTLKQKMDLAGVEMPKNQGGPDLLLRKLDCAVINYLHQWRKKTQEPACDTVRAVFMEGDPVYENAGFRHKTHIQICVRNLDAIKAVFRVSDSQLINR